MKDSPNADNPQADVELIIEELLNRFNEAELAKEPGIMLHSSVGAAFHARIMNAAKYLGIIE